MLKWPTYTPLSGPRWYRKNVRVHCSLLLHDCQRPKGNHFEKTEGYDVISTLQVLNVAHTGIAATLLMGGTTVHRQFSVPLTLKGGDKCDVRPDSEQGIDIYDADVIIWDEAVMSDRRVRCVYILIHSNTRLLHCR